MTIEGANNFHHPARNLIDRSPGSERQESLSPEAFLNRLYDATVSWFTDQKQGKVIAKLPAQTIDHWDSHQFQPGRIVELDLQLQRGVLARNNRFDFAMTLGQRKQTRYDSQQNLSLQFGFIPNQKIRTITRPEDRMHSDVEVARRLVNQWFLTCGSGEFRINDYYKDQVQIDCWADERMYGGPMIRDWSKEKLLTPHGIVACVGIVQRTAERAFL